MHSEDKINFKIGVNSCSTKVLVALQICMTVVDFPTTAENQSIDVRTSG